LDRLISAAALNGRQRPAKAAPAILLMLDRFDLHGHHQIVERNSPPCLAVQVVERVLQGLGFGQEFVAAGIFGTGFVTGVERP